MPTKKATTAPLTCYRFDEHDQVWNNWLVFAENEREEDPDDPLRVRERYRRLVCQTCFKFDHDLAYNAGFDRDVRIRARGDMIESSDGFHCVNEKFVRAIRRNGFTGLSLKRVGTDGWHAVNVKRRFDPDPRVYGQSKRACPRCGRPEEGWGVVEYASQVALPKTRGMFFTTTSGRIGMRYDDRDLFATADVAMALKKAGIKGGTFNRLLNAAEEAKARIAERAGRTPRLAHAYFVL
jgi:hypothetical protein